MKHSPNAIDDIATNLYSHFNAKMRTIERVSNRNNNKLLTLPSDIGAFILSFCDMKDQRHAALVSVDLYKMCQLPMCRSSLCVDRLFVKALAEQQIHYKRFFNVTALEIRFAFRDSKYTKKFPDFEKRYYSMLVHIIRKSPSLHTIHFDLASHGAPNLRLGAISIPENGYRSPNGYAMSGLAQTIA